MAHHQSSPIDHPEIQSASTLQYVSAFVLGLALMIVSCIITLGGGLSQSSTLTWIGILALIAVVGQLYLLFKLDLSKTMIWHTVSAVLTIPLVFISIVVTMWMFQYLEMRVMVGGS
ncbi:MAG: hypothetical protein PF501_14400 [Salinisphaera sp.]|jgi:cytochrome o ubiquinol oxidase operon protein cyoD|nr:hypothetical protein [Salinisphaera sp.]